ncbi:thioredoxin domain-containing protein [Vagococcus salmoninarum]|uniref:thioredoxin domain-containing protein n=1 Tax=Vagococcus salmoninarum TaxID=2739 RepID=UPI00187E43A4|nr:thioredoxin domain-containing protein [Vagococcus salmoninarum]MBE9390122.1 DsbA family protein [Vagococcus salmoninarum]
MDISNINVSATNTEVGLKIGDAGAPVKVIEFVNLRCPYCRQWFDESAETFAEYVASGKVQRIIKLFDKTKPGLDKGNIMHKYVPQEPTEGLAAIAAIYQSQDDWGNLESFAEVADFAEQTLGLTLAEDPAVAESIVSEAAEAGIIFVPTMVVNDDIFDQKISQTAFKALLDA